MIKNFAPSKLGWKILLYIMISIIISFFLFILFNNMLENLVTKASEEKHYYSKQLSNLVQDLQEYIDENNVSSKDMYKIEEWNQGKKYVFMSIYNNDQVIFDTINYPKKVTNKNKISVNSVKSKYLTNDYVIKFKDQKATLSIMAFLYAKYEIIITSFSFMFWALAFIIIFLILFRGKMRYIKKIEQGIKIAESGSLEYRIPVKGNDELSSLAKNINEMSSVINEQLKLGSEMRQKNNDLVTSISHDIRTPLTSVICYLDLIADNKYTDKAQYEKYVENARLNAYQIKELTENLFEHFASSSENNTYELERINANEFVFQVILDTTFDLEERGYIVDVKNELHEQIHIDVNVTQFRRIFTNISSNIYKYADNKEKIVFSAVTTNNFLIIKEKNKVNKNDDSIMSHRIGLKNCKKILTEHEGYLNVEEKDEVFTIEIGFPISSTDAKN